ncbi:sigma-70 family RNA polymerase sigma factor [Alcaligenes nematophilus]|uniref:sigma-70 family RNA polymerase sigma factor n=1 Tax=Alcaligenes nematophilus TaxID=2994643 RepID=UPI00245FBD2B|nr:sigma-70 family RNA polymerase sigma factor [Alcaligenes nematophilus]MDH4866056.1 sigma-70 family RNA polymerase sigma factor [Bacillus cereus]MDY7127356.1 sigma-70 family RNA polymerase sigma factor [Alcaligenes nematophilus]
MSRFSSSRKTWLVHYHELVKTWTRRSSNSCDGEDVAHDAIAGMLEQDVARISNPRAYLHRSAANSLIQRQKREQPALTIPLQDLSEQDHPVVSGAEEAAYCRQLSEALLAALDELPPVCQQVFSCHRLEGWTVPEIASHLGLSVSSVEKYLTRSMRHLQLKLQQFSS